MLFYRNIESGQKIRLGGGHDVHAGYLEVKSGGQWQVVCNADASWNMQAATVACRQLGYDLGAKHFDVGQNQLASFRQGSLYYLDVKL